MPNLTSKPNFSFFTFILFFVILFSLNAYSQQFNVARNNVHTAVQSGAWSDGATWGGNVPGDGENIDIPANITVSMNTVTASLNSLLIKGNLVFAEGNSIELHSHWILVTDRGVLTIGTEKAPYISKAKIVLYGTDSSEIVLGSGTHATGTKFLIAMDGGTIEIHGQSSKFMSWTHLSSNSEVGDTSITVAGDASSWKSGDEIVVASSSFRPTDSEVVTVSSVSGNKINFSPALKYKHYGKIDKIEGKDLDMRAEVGLLTRNITIQGADDSLSNSFGGHVMVMAGGSARIEGVRFFHMGQKKMLGRYPLHWHHVDRMGSGVSTGYTQWGKFNSVTDSFHRAFVIHGTSGITLEGNVIYNIQSHGYVVGEDGDEIDNKIINNLGVLVYGISNNDAVSPMAGLHQTRQNEARAGIFWMKNPNQVFTGNAAVAAVGGNGFFFDGNNMASNANDVDISKSILLKPNITSKAVFINNSAHSCGYDNGRAEIFLSYDGLATGFGLLSMDPVLNTRDQGILTFDNFTSYKNSTGGAWLHSQSEALKNSILADNAEGVDSFASIFENVIIAGKTANLIGNPTPTAHGFIFNDTTGGLFKASNITFIDVWAASFYFNDKHNIRDGASAKDVKYIRSAKFIGDRVSGKFLDEDGTVSGLGVPSYISGVKLTQDSVGIPEWRLYLTPASSKLTVNNPTINIVSPAMGSTVSLQDGGNIFVMPGVLNYDLSDNKKAYVAYIDGVENFRVTGVDRTIGGVRNLSEGPHTLTIKLFDGTNFIGIEDSVTFNYTQKNKKISIYSPSNGDIVPSTFYLKFSTAQISNSEKVRLDHEIFQFLIDGNSSEIVYLEEPLKVQGLSGGKHTLALQIIDLKGKVIDQSEVSVNVDTSIPVPTPNAVNTNIPSTTPTVTSTVIPISTGTPVVMMSPTATPTTSVNNKLVVVGKIIKKKLLTIVALDKSLWDSSCILKVYTSIDKVSPDRTLIYNLPMKRRSAIFLTYVSTIRNIMRKAKRSRSARSGIFNYIYGEAQCPKGTFNSFSKKLTT